jgi:hypothetical protein
MENISRLNHPICRPWEIEIYPHLYDHHFEGKVIFPAAEALIELAKAVQINIPEADINSLTDAYFLRFLAIPADTKVLTASVGIAAAESGINARLLSSVKSKTGNINRTVEHARVKFAGITVNQLPANPFRAVEKLAGECINVPAATVYRELVSFGAAYQNIISDLSVSRSGALAYLSGGSAPDADDDLLGSPFPFDAVLHTACVWAQRFTGVVPFPVGFVKRIIYHKTKKGETYLGRVVPAEFTRQPFIFNAWICDLQGDVCEVTEGIQMRDVTKGRMKPPAWIKAI